MTYKRRGKYRKKKYRGRRRGASKKLINAVVRVVQSRLIEKKVITYSWVSSYNTTGSVYGMPIITQGVAGNNRIGDQITVLSFYWRFYITLGDATNFLRMMFVYDKLCRGTAISAGDVLNDTSQPITSILKQDVAGRFKVYYDKVFSLTATVPMLFKKLFFKFKKPKKIYYQSTAAGIQSIAGGCFYVIIFSDSATGSLTHPGVNSSFKLQFIDA